MADSTQQQLEQAYNLIQQEQLDDAIGLLRKIINKQPNNIDAWWLLANAVTEPDDAHEALSNVLRLNPNHAEAREAFDQLMAQFPDLKPQRPAPAAPDSEDFPSDISVDIDELLRRTGPLDERRNEPLTRPEGAADVTGSYLDELWEPRPTQEAEQSELDLDELFGGKQAVDVPATPTEDEDLEALFGVTPGSKGGKRGASPEDIQALPENGGAADEMAELLAEGEAGESDIESLFGGMDMELDEIDLEEAAPEKAGDLDLDELFASGAKTPAAKTEDELLADPFAAGEPAFMQTVIAADEATQETKAAPPRPKKRRDAPPKSKPVVIQAEEAPPDPYVLERRVNRRSRLPRILLLVALILIASLGVLFIWQTQVNAPGNQAIFNALTAAITNIAATDGFSEVNGNVDGGTVKVSACSVPGPALQARVYQAMDYIADEVAKVGDLVNAAQIQVLTCGQSDMVLYRATAPVEAVKTYVAGGKKNTRVYRAAWQHN